jgi:tetratricopeptide (TPR) repeat protein
MILTIGVNTMQHRLLTTITVVAIILFSFSIFPAMAANEEALGNQAEQEGKLRQALTHYVAALNADENNQQLREKIIKIAQNLNPLPAVPETAERYLVRGEAAVETANDEQGYTRAAGEFNKALQVAPWLADAYFNLGVVLDKAGKYDEAIDNLNLYLIAVPHDKEAKKLKYKIEYRKEEAQRVSVRKKELQREKTQRRDEERINGLSGQWQRVKNWIDGNDAGGKPTREGRHWVDITSSASAIVSVHESRIEIKVQLSGGTYIYEGKINSNRIHGHAKNGSNRCPDFGGDFEGEIWLEEDVIMIIGQGYRDYYCNLHSDSYRSSYLLQR